MSPESVGPADRYLTGSVVESAVGVVIVRAGARRNAMTVSFFSEVAHHPTSMWVSIETKCYTHELLRENGCFTFVTLHRHQGRIALACGMVSGRDFDKCANLDLYEASDGYLFLRGGMASTACRVRHELLLGSHTVFIADMLAGDWDTRAAGSRQLLLSDL
jgi:flavin reductase (DIM6/NTAB) family NADH-FMN oxidoreductase RutF